MSQLSHSTKTQAQGKLTSIIRPSVTIAFILALALYGSAFLHFQTAIICASHTNPLPFPSEKEDFKRAVASLVLFLVTVAYINIVHVLLNALLLLFGSSSQRRTPFILGIVVNVIGILSCLTAIIKVIVVGGQWNSLNGSSSTFYNLRTSVFIGDLSTFEHNFRLEVLLGFLLFLPIDIYLVWFWNWSMNNRKRPAPIYEQMAKEANENIKMYQKQEDDISNIEKKIPKLQEKQSFEE